MAVTVKLSRQLKNLLKENNNAGLIPKVRKEFAKRGPIKVKQAIVQDMIKGISPVKGQGKWKKYSPSYKAVIDGKKTFRRFGGKVVVQNKKDEAFFAKSSPTKMKSPVNLRHSGGLHKSLKAFTTGGFLRSFKLVVLFKKQTGRHS